MSTGDEVPSTTKLDKLKARVEVANECGRYWPTLRRGSLPAVVPPVRAGTRLGHASGDQGESALRAGAVCGVRHARPGRRLQRPASTFLGAKRPGRTGTGVMPAERSPGGLRLPGPRAAVVSTYWQGTGINSPQPVHATLQQVGAGLQVRRLMNLHTVKTIAHAGLGEALEFGVLLCNVAVQPVHEQLQYRPPATRRAVLLRRPGKQVLPLGELDAFWLPVRMVGVRR